MPQTASSTQNILVLTWDWVTWSFGVELGGPALAVVLIGLICTLAAWLLPRLRRNELMEIDQTEIGIGESKIVFRPNNTDRQVAYAIWVELSTRKIGLPIDLDDDVIIEIYDSWYNYFSVTRDMIKTIAVSKVRGASTRAIVNLSIDVLNEGLRPHLTKWQARFRHWHEKELEKKDKSGVEVVDPQLMQKKFPQYEELKKELLEINKKLIFYRGKMQAIVFDKT
ncbi:hypothetical protein FF80_03052 [Devosia sp. LC5]|uniref:hypothetical protein n=1 Tax=Devosia sp. LC5 TaxID=1502724 RepID=UPI0004E39F82|nr:hypothetical protein [Devosia sp. LC5]KFC64430.1 hypothetical protein FF80_03052 [Devosia sp. LC5]